MRRDSTFEMLTFFKIFYTIGIKALMESPFLRNSKILPLLVVK